MMKKFIALLTVFALLIGVIQIPGGIFAEENPKITLKQAIEIAKETLDLNTEGFEFNSSYNENYNGFNVWNLNWNNAKRNESINVFIDADKGEIVSLYFYKPYEQPKSRIPKYSKAEALKAAEQWAEKLQGEKFKLTKLKENNNQDYYSRYSDVFYFEFVRVQDGIEVAQNNITVQIDKNTLKLRNFNVIWDKQSLPSKDKAFNLDKAKEIFKEKLGLELTYELVYTGQDGDPKAILAYTLKNGNLPIDAISGELLRNMYRIYYALDKGGVAEQVTAVPITPQEQTELDKNSSYITKEEAIQAVKQFIKIDENAKLERANLFPGYQKYHATWNLDWKITSADGKTIKYLGATVDAVTKELRSLYTYYNTENPNKGKTEISKEKAKKLAEEFLSKIQPEKFKKTQYKEVNIENDVYYRIMPVYSDGYSFNYIRVENGIPFPGNSLSVGIDKYTGEITAYNANWLDIDFPAPDKVISLEKAYEVLFNNLKFGLEYTYHYPNINDYNNKEIRLAYTLENANVLIDANEGKMLNYDGTPVKSDKKFEYTDIKGHKAEEAINILMEMKILVPESDKFEPDSKMLQKDFIKLLVSSLEENYYPMPVAKDENPYDNYYNEAIRRKIIAENEKNPEAVVTRQDAAKMIVRAMNYGVLAERGNMFSANFKDAANLSSAYKGYAVIAAELGIVTPINSWFYPLKDITRGEAAEIIVNYLKCDTSL